MEPAPRTEGPSVGNHRGRESGRLVYPVISRRSGGLSLGVELFPEAKTCNFDCPYCEVFPFEGSAPFAPADLEEELATFVEANYRAAWSPEPVRDICISGSGEPTLSPHLGEALEICARIRDAHRDVLGAAKLVLITNSTGFLNAEVRALLHRHVREEDLAIWAKLDGASDGLFALMSRSRYFIGEIVEAIRAFALVSPISIQTMACAIDVPRPADPGSAKASQAPDRRRSLQAEEIEAYGRVVSELSTSGARLRQIQLYTQARPSPESLTAPLADDELAGVAAALRRALPPGLPLRVFGSSGALAATGPWP
jgi:hypothetical protein